jgi:hypothetical protein
LALLNPNALSRGKCSWIPIVSIPTIWISTVEQIGWYG